MNERTMEDILSAVDKELTTTVAELPAPLPAKAEKMAQAVQKQFNLTADRCDSLADKLDKIIDRLRHQSSHLRHQAQTLPEELLAQIRFEREFESFAAYYEPLVSDR